jgi:hypothetical protein
MFFNAASASVSALRTDGLNLRVSSAILLLSFCLFLFAALGGALRRPFGRNTLPKAWKWAENCGFSGELEEMRCVAVQMRCVTVAMCAVALALSGATAALH